MLLPSGSLPLPNVPPSTGTAICIPVWEREKRRKKKGKKGGRERKKERKGDRNKETLGKGIKNKNKTR